MISKLKKFLRGEGGITGLETAIILIAFVVVAAVFAFTVLSAGVFSADRGKEAVYAGLAEVSGSMEVMGSVIALGVTNATALDGRISYVIFSVANVAGGQPVDFTEPTNVTSGVPGSGSKHKVVIGYRDKNNIYADLAWTKEAQGNDDLDDLLEAGEIFEITVPVSVSGGVTTSLTINTIFYIEVKPETGGVLVIKRTTPAYIDKIVDLH